MMVFVTFDLVLLILCHREHHPSDGPALVLPSPMPNAPRKARPLPHTPPSVGTKRPLPEDENGPPAKRQKIQTNGVPNASPSKGYKEVDGILVIEDDQEDDIIVIED